MDLNMTRYDKLEKYGIYIGMSFIAYGIEYLITRKIKKDTWSVLNTKSNKQISGVQSADILFFKNRHRR
jgi:hypothetical protein